MNNKRPLNLTDDRWVDVRVFPIITNGFITTRRLTQSELEGVPFNQTVINDNSMRKLDKE